jgi:ubiquinol-cytochrome c reductase subunit 6
VNQEPKAEESKDNAETKDEDSKDEEETSEDSEEKEEDEEELEDPKDKFEAGSSNPSSVLPSLPHPNAAIARPKFGGILTSLECW